MFNCFLYTGVGHKSGLGFGKIIDEDGEIIGDYHFLFPRDVCLIYTESTFAESYPENSVDTQS